jgi:signal transduction histidine kinase
MSAGHPQPAVGGTTLRQRLARVLLAAGVVLGIVVVCAGLAVDRMIDRQEAVTGTYFTALTSAEAAYTRLVDAETAVRGYLLTGDPVTLEPYERAQESSRTFVELAAESRRDVVSDDLADVARTASQAATRWQESFATPVIATVASQGSGSVPTEQIEQGRVLFDETRSAVETYLDELRTIRQGAVDELATWTRIVTALVLVLSLAAVAVGVALWVTLRQWIAAPLAALAADARAVSSGDLRRAVLATGPGEIASLALDVERMRVTLVDQLGALAASTAEIAAAHEQLTEQAEELRRSNRDLEQFAYVASHDLQEPLRKVASFTQLLQKRYGGQLDERADQYIEFAVDGAKRMQQLIQDLLGFSRVGRLVGDPVDVDLGSALADALSNLDEAVAESGATVTHDPLPVVRGERGLLVQLLQNLVGNAIKFHGDVPPRIHVTAREVADSWELECRDNGIGIDAQYADRVFVIFQRLHAKDVYDGTGIGLALCKKIVEHHGGRIWIEPSVEQGTSVRWTLPRAAED